MYNQRFTNVLQVNTSELSSCASHNINKITSCRKLTCMTQRAPLFLDQVRDLWIEETLLHRVPAWKGRYPPTAVGLRTTNIHTKPFANFGNVITTTKGTKNSYKFLQISEGFRNDFVERITHATCNGLQQIIFIQHEIFLEYTLTDSHESTFQHLLQTVQEDALPSRFSETGELPA